MIFDVVSFGQAYGIVLLSFTIGICIGSVLNAVKLTTRVM